jgi:hypothetical protein
MRAHDVSGMVSVARNLANPSARHEPVRSLRTASPQQAIPLSRFQALKTVDDMIGLIAAEVSDREAIDPVLSRLMLEAMREAERWVILPSSTVGPVGTRGARACSATSSAPRA